MTKKRLEPAFVVRAATADDEEKLSAFRCSTGPWYEDDVEEYIRTRALRAATGMPSSYRLLLVLEEERLIACAAHRLEALPLAPDKLVIAARLQLLAIAAQDRGRVLDGALRLSDALIQTALADAFEHRPTRVATAIVAQDNLRSMALCERNGLRSQVRYDYRHVRLSGQFDEA